MFHFVSLETPSFWSPLELNHIADTNQEESPTFIKNWSVRNQINPSWKSMFSSPGCREVSKYTVEKLGSAFKFGHHATEGIDTIITSLVRAFSDGFLS